MTISNLREKWFVLNGAFLIIQNPIFVLPVKHSATKGSLCLVSVCPSVCVCVCLSGSHTFLVVTHSYVSQATHAFLGMLPLCFYPKNTKNLLDLCFNNIFTSSVENFIRIDAMLFVI